MEILVFKTNIRYKKHVTIIAPHLQAFDGIIDWNVDLNDRDKVLRIKASQVAPASIEKLVQGAGYHCKELPD